MQGRAVRHVGIIRHRFAQRQCAMRRQLGHQPIRQGAIAVFLLGLIDGFGAIRVPTAGRDDEALTDFRHPAAQGASS